MANPITFSGLGSGIDMASIVTAMIDTEKARYVTPIENWKQGWSDKITSFQDLNTKLAAFQSTVKGLDTPAEFLVKTASASNETVLQATANDNAINSSYTVEVNQLAKVEKETHAGHADKDTTAVTTVNGTFSYTYNGHARTIDVNANAKLTDVVNFINNDAQNPGVTASIIDDGSGTATAYHLVLTGNSTGAAYTITGISHTLNNFATGGTTGGGFTQTQQALNSRMRVDGYPASSWIERSTNQTSDVIAGVNLTLAGPGTSSITVSTDTAAIKTKVQEFVDAFNEIRTYIKDKTSYDTNTNKAGILLGNYAVDIIKNKLNNIMSTSPSGFRDGYDTYVNLMQLGIYTDAEPGSETEGKLIINESVLTKALNSNPQAVADLFSDDFTGRSASANLAYGGYLDTFTKAGTYEIKFTAGATPPNTSTGQIRLKGTTDWHNATWDRTNQTLTGISGPEAGLVVRVINTATSFTGEIDLKKGIAGDMKEELDLLTDSNEGPLAVLDNNYQDIIDNAQKKIDYEEKRITLLQQRLTERYARLEKLLSDLNGQSEYIKSRVNQLSAQ